MESPESPRICFFFIPGDQPLSNGISAFPDPDDALFGPLKPYVPSTEAPFEAPSFDMDCSLFGPTPFDPPATGAAMPLGPRPAPPVLPKTDLSLESVESIFADLYASCGTSDPFLEPEPVYGVLEALDKAATLLQDLSLAGAAHEAEESDDDDYYSEDESDDELPTMDVDERPICPLPGRTALQDATPVYRTRAAMRAAGLSPVSSPIPTFRNRRTVAAASSDVAVTTPAKRRAPHAKGPRATKCLAIQDASSTDSTPIPVPSISSPAAEKLPPTSNDDTLPAGLQKLFDLGCTLVGSKTVACYLPTCDHTCAYGDMGRHIQIHDRIAAQCFCDGCPRSFARLDSLTRHIKSHNSGHFTPERKVFLKNVFEVLPLVVRKRAECDYGHPKNLPVQEMNKALDALFNQLFTASRKAKA